MIFPLSISLLAVLRRISSFHLLIESLRTVAFEEAFKQTVDWFLKYL